MAFAMAIITNTGIRGVLPRRMLSSMGIPCPQDLSSNRSLAGDRPVAVAL